MSKLTVMKYNQIMMAILGINPYTFASPTSKRLQSLCSLLIITIMAACAALAVLYAYQETRLPLILEAIGLMIGATASLCSYLNMKWKKESTGEFNSRLQEIVNEAYSERTLAPVYWTAEQKCRRLIKQMVAFILLEQSAFVLASFLAIYNICVGNFDTSTYYLPLRVAPPFNVASLYAWYLFCALQFICGVAYLCGTVVVTGYFACCCFYLEALCDHFDCLMESVDAELQENPSSLNAHKMLIDVIDHHVRIYAMYDMLKEISSGTIFAFLVMNAPFLGISFYNLEHIDAEWSFESAATIAFSISLIFCGLLWSFVLCHYGTFATERIQSLDLTMYNANWLDYPDDLRKQIILIIAKSRSNISFNGFKILGCNLEIFSKICNSACSYYLIFRRFTQRL